MSGARFASLDLLSSWTLLAQRPVATSQPRHARASSASSALRHIRGHAHHGVDRARGLDILQRVGIQQHQVGGLAFGDAAVAVQRTEPRRTRTGCRRQRLRGSQAFLDEQAQLVSAGRYRDS